MATANEPERKSLTSRYYAPGEIVAGKYELQSPLGEGGMGSVWRARNLALESSVAIKLIRAELELEEAGDRLLQEARAAARLGHPAICKVFDFGHTEQGDPFIVMELLDGQSLSDALAAKNRMSATLAAQILLPIIDALATAHARGIVHRDLKPDNIFLAKEGRRTQPKVVDFGIAKMEQTATVNRTLTRQGMVLGSPGYMSPEQARGDSRVDFRADIWSLSVVFYECITGEAAFLGDNYNALMRAIIEDDVVPTTKLSAGDEALWAILERGLAKDAAARWPSMRDFGVALAEWLVSHDIEQDVCGDGLSGWLSAAEPEGRRDLQTVRPAPSVREARRTPAAAHTVGGEIDPLRQGPESTSAVVQTTSPRRTQIPRSGLLLGGGIGLVAFVFLVFMTAGGPKATPEPAPAAPPKAAATMHVEAPAPAAAPAVTEPIPPSVPSTRPVQPLRVQPAALRKPAAKDRAAPANAKAAPKATPTRPGVSTGLKDPY